MRRRLHPRLVQVFYNVHTKVHKIQVELFKHIKKEKVHNNTKLMKFSVKELTKAFKDYTELLLNIKFISPDRTKNNDAFINCTRLFY